MPDLFLQGISIEQIESLIEKAIQRSFDGAYKSISNNPPVANEVKYLTRQEVAKRLNISLPTLLKYSLEGLIPSYRIGARVLFKEAEIENALLRITTAKFKKS